MSELTEERGQGRLRGAVEVPQVCLRGALEVPQVCLRGALEVPWRCLGGFLGLSQRGLGGARLKFAIVSEVAEEQGQVKQSSGAP